MSFKGKKTSRTRKNDNRFNVYVLRYAGTLSFKLGSHFYLIQIQKFGQTGISQSGREFFCITMYHSVKYRLIDTKKENLVAKFYKEKIQKENR